MVIEASCDSSPVPAEESQISFSALLKNGVVEVAGKPCGRVYDIIVQLRPNDFA